MSDDQNDYAHGHGPRAPVAVKHHTFREGPNKTSELHLTSESGLHYLFSFTGPQSYFGTRKWTEVLSRISDTKRSA